MFRAITMSSVVSAIGQRMSVGVGSNVIGVVSSKMPAAICRPSGAIIRPTVLHMIRINGSGTCRTMALHPAARSKRVITSSIVRFSGPPMPTT